VISENTVGPVRRFLTKNTNLVHRHLQRFVCPILRADERGRPELAGSSVPFKVAGLRFLPTAAHVVDDPDRQPYVFGRNVDGRFEFVELFHERTDTVPPPEGREHDHIDAAVLLLSDEAANAVVCNHSFLGPEHLDINGRSSSDDRYAFIGYPRSRFDLWPGNRLRFAGAMYELTGATEDKYQQLQIDSSIQIAANFDPKSYRDKGGKKLNPLNPNGISGGGIWTLQTKESKSVGFHDPRLAGIAIECRTTHKAMVGVRVNVFLGLIARTYPNTRRLFFPEGTVFPEI
jgi:hypothetical protein